MVHESICFRHRPELRTEGAEDEWIEVVSEQSRERFLFCSVYIPPGCVEQLMLFRATLEKVRNVERNVIVLGDFNARCLSLGDTRNNSLASHFQDLVDECEMHICNEYAVATRKASTRKRDSI